MAHAQKPDFVFRRNGRVHLNRRGRQFSRLLEAEVCASAVAMVVMLDTPCSEVVWRVLAAHSIRQFPLHFPYRASPRAITFQLDSPAAKPEVFLSQYWGFYLPGSFVLVRSSVTTLDHNLNKWRHLMNTSYVLHTLTSCLSVTILRLFVLRE
jgi:hypothetical protein